MCVLYMFPDAIFIAIIVLYCFSTIGNRLMDIPIPDVLIVTRLVLSALHVAPAGHVVFG